MDSSKNDNKKKSIDSSFPPELTYLNINVEYVSYNIHKSKVDINNNVNIRS